MVSFKISHQEYKVGDRWMKAEELKDSYPDLYEMANQRDACGNLTLNAVTAKRKIAKLIATLPVRFVGQMF